jgi:hypothetical protein
MLLMGFLEALAVIGLLAGTIGFILLISLVILWLAEKK